MKSPKSLTVVVRILLVLLLFITIGCRYKHQSFKQNRLSGGELRSPWQFFFAHVSDEYYLTINEKTFKRVRGTSPFYLDIPQLNAILFVTGKMDQPAVFHIYSLGDKTDRTIEGGPVGFGWDMGGNKPKGAPWSVYLLSAGENEIKLGWRGSDGVSVIVLHLNSSTIELPKD